METRVLGARIRALREEKGWSQGVLAYKCDTTAAQISRLEHNERPGVGAVLLGRIAVALDTNLEYLLGQSNDPVRRPDAGPELADEREVMLRRQAEELIRRWRLVNRYAPEQLPKLINIAFTQAALVLGAAGAEETEETDEDSPNL